MFCDILFDVLSTFCSIIVVWLNNPWFFVSFGGLVIKNIGQWKLRFSVQSNFACNVLPMTLGKDRLVKWVGKKHLLRISQRVPLNTVVG